MHQDIGVLSLSIYELEALLEVDFLGAEIGYLNEKMLNFGT